MPLGNNDESIYTALYRYAAVCKICNINFKDSIRQISDKTLSDIRFDYHSPAVDSLLILYGIGCLSEDVVCFLIKHYDNLLEDDIAGAEKNALEQNELNDEDKLSAAQTEAALLTAANSIIYKMQRISFDEALKISAMPFVQIKNGFVYITSKDMFDFLSDNISFGYIEENDTLYTETAENLKTLTEEDTRPFIIDLHDFLSISAFCSEAYGREFIGWAKENGSPMTEEEYQKYVQQIKLKFDIRSYRRKRNVCGNRVNWFDYAPSADNNPDELNADYSREIVLEIDRNYSDEELRKKAVDKFRSTYTLDVGTVIEVYHCRKRYLYYLDESGLKDIDNTEFHKLLFDFNKIWSIIQLCSRNRKIRAVNNGGNTTITIDDESWEEIPADQREYASRLVREQYEQQKEKRRSSAFLQRLSSLKAEAAEQKSKSDREKAELEQQKAKMLQKRDNRDKAIDDNTEG